MPFTSPSAYSTWSAIPDAELTLDSINRLLIPIQDDLWVVAACADRILDDTDVQHALLDLGLTRTLHAIERCKATYNPAFASETSNENGSLISHFQSSGSDAHMCFLRAVLLERLDRLNTYVEICKEVPEVQQTETEEGLEDWEDDPWADGTEDSTIQQTKMSNFRPPIALSTFLTTDLVSLTCHLSTVQWLGALHILFKRHTGELLPYRFKIIANIPEHINPLEYRDILPAFNHKTGLEQIITSEPWRTKPDFVELEEVRAALESCHFPFYQKREVESCEANAKDCLSPLSHEDLMSWYKSRVNHILSSTGMIDVALTLVQHGASQGISGLDELGEELSLLSRLVYDTPHEEASHFADDWTLDAWHSMDPPSVVRAYLTHSTPNTLPQDVTRLVMPYLFVLESRAERAGTPDPSLPSRMLYNYVLSAPLEMAAAIFEASKPTLPAAQRLIRDDEDIARLALALIYGSDNLTEWSVMSRIFECLPAWNIEAEDDNDEDAADTTVASLGAFSTIRPQCTASDLLVFFKPLPLTSLSRALDILDVHLESGEILARWSVPAPPRWFLQSSSDIHEQRAWANRMARRAGGQHDQLNTLDDWEWLLEDMLKLAGRGDTGIAGAFGLLSKEDVMRIFLGGLLSTGNFMVAKSILSVPHTKLRLNAAVVEEICLSSSREFYDNASSGNYNFGEMKLAYDCLDVPPQTRQVIKEKEFIEATSRICSFNVITRSGTPISPIEIRLAKDRLSLISRVLSSNSDAYKHTEMILDLCYKLGFRHDTVAEVKVLAMLADTALQAEDFDHAFDVSERMVDKVSQFREACPVGFEDPRFEEINEVCWVACFQLGRQLEFNQLDKKLSLLGRALELCPADKLHDILTAWRRLEKEDVEQREERLSHRQKGTANGSKNQKSKISLAASGGVASSLRARLHEFHMPSPPLLNTPDAAALASRTFKTVAANLPFSMGSRGRSVASETDSKGSRSGSQSRFSADDVSTQATRVISKGIGWLMGADEEY
ncbi:hypothetical protein AMATHDRAFT_134847 [Amanita thiersii Skay4041]|uniref:Sec39 domain-containing protein n=1 Tax=Amanita thiersii Skay4041 TaxID=703135 RepID=A0A2A9NW38_9AGAR|nr:hypothetical protein AMATHDRAFT_134847 [Amanita thiersii Skay4041]